MVIINADDFGLSESVNHAIIDALKHRLCSSTTIMANMPGFEEACHLAHEHKLLNHIGLHLNLGQGYPLTEKMKQVGRFCDSEGQLCVASTNPVFQLSTSEQHALADEIRAQISRCRNYGITLTHMDSHYHLHTHWAVLTVLIVVVRETGIHYIRMARNCGANTGFVKGCYERLVNVRLRRENLARTEFFGNVEDYVFQNARTKVPAERAGFEVMVHPVYNQVGVLVDQQEDTPLAQAVSFVDSYQSAVSFSGACYP